MALSWNEIKSRAVEFTKEWAGTKNEEADAKPFLDAFFNVFGISRKKVGTFEHKVKKLSESDGYIDLLWKGTILIEMKSLGKNLDKAFQQAIDYTHGLKSFELPKYIMVSDFFTFRLYDTEEQNTIEFTLPEFINNIQHFGFIAGYQKRVFKDEDPVNIAAAELMGKIHDRLKEVGYDGHPLELYLVRLLFCLFADDTSIFEKGIFQDYITANTKEDGSDLAYQLAGIFQVLNTPNDKRLRNLDEAMTQFPYVNGKLFEEQLPLASFDSNMRNLLLECSYLDWGKISPAIFGSMFQSVMNPTERRNLGAHYTSEKNIMKLIKPLFLDELWSEFESIKHDRNKLKTLQQRISNLRFLDPACGCGNFLVITYREIRNLEIVILKQILSSEQMLTDVHNFLLCDVDKFYGIEIEEFPAQIAQVAMWLMDHQMNMQFSTEFGEYFVRLPLKKSATINNGNSLRIDWASLLDDGEHFNFILGNPPFIGSKIMTQEQRDDVIRIFNNIKGSGTLDFVSAWYAKAAEYMQNGKTQAAFVSTNSITQGEQVGVIWKYLLDKYKIRINFAHKTFKWSNEARGNAAVYCVIIGFSTIENQKKYIYEYEDIKGEPHEVVVSKINPYLVEADNIILTKRKQPINNAPKIVFGNMPNDNGNLLLDDFEKQHLIEIEPNLKNVIRQTVGAYEFINNITRWCIWLKGASPDIIKKSTELNERIKRVKEHRQNSTRESTRKLALIPSLFGEIRQSSKEFILIPSTSSENRIYIPIGFFKNDEIALNSCHIIPDGTLYDFGILTSIMHMSWVKYVCGRLESRFRYSAEIVYNNFPFPENPSAKQLEAIKKSAQKVLDARALFPESSLATLYDPISIPPELVKAHNELDRAVDLAYRPQPFTSEAKRMEFLFELYEKYTAGMFAKEKKKNTRNK